MDNLGFLIAGYGITAATLTAYYVSLRIRARRATSRAAELANRS